MAGKSLKPSRKPSRGSPGRNLVRGPAAPQKARTVQRARQALVRESESNTKYGMTAKNYGDEFREAAQVSGIRERFGRGWRYVSAMKSSWQCHQAGKATNR